MDNPGAPGPGPVFISPLNENDSYVFKGLFKKLSILDKDIIGSAKAKISTRRPLWKKFAIPALEA